MHNARTDRGKSPRAKNIGIIILREPDKITNISKWGQAPDIVRFARNVVCKSPPRLLSIKIFEFQISQYRSNSIG